VSDTFELSILNAGGAQVIAFARSGFDTAMATLSVAQLPTLARFRSRLSEAAQGRALSRPTDKELLDFGVALFNVLVSGDIARVYARSPANQHVRLQILSDHPAIQEIPWEYMRDPVVRQVLNTNRSIVRLIPTIGIEPVPRKRLGSGINVLFAYAEPPGVPGVGWDEVKATVESELAAWSQGATIDVVAGATVQSLLGSLNAKVYDVLHLICHGEVDSKGDGRLLLLDLTGKRPDPIDARKLGQILVNRGLRLVVLSSCNGAAGDFAREFAVIGRALVECGIPAVVANQFEIERTLVSKFARGFYGELARSGDVDLATTMGREQLSLVTAPPGAANIAWGIPALYRHLGAARAF
jgi:hypothetical protein